MSVVKEPPARAQEAEILPLEMGDHLDRATFHVRYEAMPPGIKAELIDGVVFMPSPARKQHGVFMALVGGWLMDYVAATPGVEALDNTTVVLSDTSEPQPDWSLIVKPECGGQTREEEGWVMGAPEFVVEVASSTAAYDLHRKLWAYEAAGVREYVVVLTREQTLSWYVLRQGKYSEMSPAEDGVFRSEAFPGLWLEPRRLLSGDIAGVKAVLAQGVASAEHAEFVARLKGAAA